MEGNEIPYLDIAPNEHAAILPESTPTPPPVLHGPNISNDSCEVFAQFPTQYDVTMSVVAALCLAFGLFYTFVGYRFFKISMFLTGFVSGSVIVYMVCVEENVLPPEGNAGVSLAGGLLFGLITMLVYYVGLFMIGFHSGVLLGMTSLLVIETFHYLDTTWASVGILFGCGLLVALGTLYWQRVATIACTALVGGALIMAGLDHFFNHFIVVHHMWSRVRVIYISTLCWPSWLVFACWPLVSVSGAMVQWRWTAVNYNHRDSRTLIIRRRRAASSSKGRRHASPRLQVASRAAPGESSRARDHHTKYRYLYQVRRADGDVIAKSRHPGAPPSTGERRQPPSGRGTDHRHRPLPPLPPHVAAGTKSSSSSGLLHLHRGGASTRMSSRSPTDSLASASSVALDLRSTDSALS